MYLKPGLFSLLSSSFSSIFCQLASYPADLRGPWFCQVAPIWRWCFLFFSFLFPFLDRWVSASWAKRQVLTLIPLAQVLGGQLIFSPGSLLLSSTWGKGLHFHKLLRGVSTPPPTHLPSDTEDIPWCPFHTGEIRSICFFVGIWGWEWAACQ